MNYAIVIPTLNPDEKMTAFVDALVQAGCGDIVLVNDGSKPETVKYFEQAAQYPQVTVLTHEVNKGKGAGLKTAFSYLAANRKDIDAAVTADADGQHNLESIGRCTAAYEEKPGTVIFGGREFSDKNIPWRSRYGNNISSVVYRFACGIKLRDTQTGLRIIPKEYFEKFSTLKGDRYEYETNMIVAVRELNIPYKEVPIETIYIDDNASSHFNPIKDSAKIYGIVLRYFFKFLLSSLASWCVDIGLFWLVIAICDKVWGLESGVSGTSSFFAAIFKGTWNHYITANLLATVISRVISSIVNYMINRKVVFKTTDNVRQTVVRYYILAVCQLFISFLLVDLLADELFHVTGFLNVIVKCVVDGCLFLFSFGIQRKWVFKNKKI